MSAGAKAMFEKFAGCEPRQEAASWLARFGHRVPLTGLILLRQKSFGGAAKRRARNQ